MPIMDFVQRHRRIILVTQAVLVLLTFVAFLCMRFGYYQKLSSYDLMTGASITSYNQCGLEWDTGFVANDVSRWASAILDQSDVPHTTGLGTGSIMTRRWFGSTLVGRGFAPVPSYIFRSAHDADRKIALLREYWVRLDRQSYDDVLTWGRAIIDNE